MQHTSGVSGGAGIFINAVRAVVYRVTAIGIVNTRAVRALILQFGIALVCDETGNTILITF